MNEESEHKLINLKPCKCSNIPWFEAYPVYENDQVDDVWVFVECIKCGLHTGPYPDEELAARAWNYGLSAHRETKE